MIPTQNQKNKYMSEQKSVSLDQFGLKKAKILKNGGLSISFKLRVSDGGVSADLDYDNIKSPITPHPDLTDKLNDLKDFLIKSTGRQDVLKILSEPGTADMKDAAKKLLPMVEGFFEQRKTLTKVTGLSISGEAENCGVIVTGTETNANNMDSGFASPRIILNREVFGFENDLAEIAREIEIEVFNYHFCGKRSQLQLFENQPKKEKKEKKAKNQKTIEDEINEQGNDSDSGEGKTPEKGETPVKTKKPSKKPVKKTTPPKSKPTGGKKSKKK